MGGRRHTYWPPRSLSRRGGSDERREVEGRRICAIMDTGRGEKPNQRPRLELRLSNHRAPIDGQRQFTAVSQSPGDAGALLPRPVLCHSTGRGGGKSRRLAVGHVHNTASTTTAVRLRVRQLRASNRRTRVRERPQCTARAGQGAFKTRVSHDYCQSKSARLNGPKPCFVDC